MKLEEYNYLLPKELIAQNPTIKRDHSKLMLLNKHTGEIKITLFKNLPFFLKQNDVLVINNSKVVPYRIYGIKNTCTKIEILLLKNLEKNIWKAMIKPAKKIKVNEKIFLKLPNSYIKILLRESDKIWIIKLNLQQTFNSFLKKYGNIPLPPYIKRSNQKSNIFDDTKRYQTIYAKVPGSLASPTAGLHFTTGLLSRLKLFNINIANLTLHVSYGTFLPIITENIKDHTMVEEEFELNKLNAEIINSSQRTIAVGTTSVRVLETIADNITGKIKAINGFTKLYIYPGYNFKHIQGLITNFHLPKSSLFLLVAAFAGKTNLLNAYKVAIKNKFRFYSYGDCMLII